MKENVTDQRTQDAVEERDEERSDEREARAEAETREDRLEELESELSKTRDQLLRQAAEFKNYRRRVDKEKGSLLQLGQSQVVQQMLDVLDDFRRALESAEQVAEEQQGDPGPAYVALHEGVELVYQKFVDELSKLGVEPIEAVGEPFDENLHEALMQQPAPDDTPPGTVLEEVQKGYRMGDRVLRHSKVVVAG